MIGGKVLLERLSRYCQCPVLRPISLIHPMSPPLHSFPPIFHPCSRLSFNAVAPFFHPSCPSSPRCSPSSIMPTRADAGHSLGYAIPTLGLRPTNLIARIGRSNTASIALFESLGFGIVKVVEVWDEVEMRWGHTPGLHLPQLGSGDGEERADKR